MLFLENLFWVVHILVAVAICCFVLLQHGKGADMGAAFGSGASGSIFGSAGSANFLSRTTAALATVFFITSLGLTYYATKQAAPEDDSLMNRAAKIQPKETPVVPVTPSDVPSAPASSAAPGNAASTVPDVPAAPPAGAASTEGKAETESAPKP